MVSASEGSIGKLRLLSSWLQHTGLLLLLVLVASYWDTLFSMAEIWWRQGTYTHGFLIIPISLYLIWSKKERLLKVDVVPIDKVLIVLVCFVFLWVLAFAADVLVIQQLCVVAMIPILVLQIFGTKIFFTILFPLAYLFFAVPIGDFLIPPMQDITATFTVNALRLTGIPVFWEGRFFNLPSGSFEVAEACSGVRYLIASIALGTLFAYYTYKTYWKRTLFIAFSIIVPIIANTIRAYTIVMIAHYSDFKFAIGIDHIIYGWLFFGFVIFFMFWVGTKFQEQRSDHESCEQRIVNTDVRRIQKSLLSPITLLTILILISGPLSAKWITMQPAMRIVDSLETELIIESWGRSSDIDPHWKPSYIGASSEYNVSHKNGDNAVQLYIAQYATQRQGFEMINSENVVYDRKKWKRIQGSIRTIELESGGWQVRETIISSKHGSKVIWNWFIVRGTATVNSIYAKLNEARGRLIRDKRGSAVIVLAANYKVDKEEARASLRSFLGEALPNIQSTFE